MDPAQKTSPADEQEDTALPAQDQHSDQSQGQPGWTPPASQDELDRIIKDRLNRERAKYADYDQLKAAADELAQIKAEQLTEAEQAAARAEAAEQRAAELEQVVLRSRVEAAAKDANIVNVDQMLALLGPDAFADDTDVGEVISTFATENPHFVTPPAPQVPKVEGASAPTGGGSGFTREQVAAMTPEEYERNRAAIRASAANW